MAIRLQHQPDRPETAPIALTRLLNQCRAGELPAEVLPPDARAQLVAELHRRGWTDTEIATHTRMTTYTTARIRDALLLPSNRPATEGTDAA